MGGTTTISTSEERINGLKVQSSVYGLAIPLMWGRARMSGNLIDYLDFTAVPKTTTQSAGGKGGGVEQSSTTYTYTAAVMIGLCEGPVQSASAVFRDKEIYGDGPDGTALFKTGLSFANGAPGQPVWGYLTTNHADHALGYSQTAHVYAAGYTINNNGSLQNHSIEVNGSYQVAGRADANPAQIVADFLTNPYYGVPGFPAGLMGNLSAYSSYCLAANLLISPVLASQQSAADVLKEWMAVTNSEIVYSENRIKVIPYGDAGITGNGATYTPNLTPLFDLGDDDYQGGSDDPLRADRIRATDAMNSLSCEFLDRAQQYNPAISTAFDQASIEVYGLLKGSPMSWHCICDADVARTAIELYKNRTLLRRNTYTFKLGLQYSTLEPMDLVTITDAALGLLRRLVRITEVAEDGEDEFTITAEDALPGTGNGSAVAGALAQGGIVNAGSDPGSVTTPLIFAGPTSLTGGATELWAAVAGSNAAWGGAEVWASLTGSNYARIGAVNGPARYGVLSAALPAVADPDTTSMLTVNLAASKGALLPATQVDADSGNTLLLIDQELLTYKDAALTGNYAYGLSKLRRGFNNTGVAAHPAGAQIVRLDGALFRYPYTSAQVGQTLHLKFRSFNVFGQRLQDLAACTDYTTSIGSPPPDLTGFSLAATGSQATFSWNPVTALQVLNGGYVVIRFNSATTGATWENSMEVLRAPGNATQITGAYSSGTYLAKLLDASGQYSTNAVTQGGSTAGGGGGALTATVTPTSLTGSGAGSVVTTGSAATASASGGATPYSYAWSRVSGDTTTSATNPTSAVSKFTASGMSGAGDTRTSVWKCTVTDSTSPIAQTAVTPNITVTLKGTSPPENCVHIESWLPQRGRAGDLALGERILVADERTLDDALETVSLSELHLEPCVRIVTACGAALICTVNAPIAVAGGELVQAEALLGYYAAVLTPELRGHSRVIKVEQLGVMPVQRITVANKSFWAGETAGFYILHHNIKP